MRHFAKRLTVYERRTSKHSETTIPPAFQVCEKLRTHLGTFMGAAGFRELLSCALPRANAEIPWLRSVHVKTDGALEGLEELSAQRNPDELFEGGVVLVAQLLELLTAFIGEALTVRFVREIWPQVPFDNLDLDKGSKDEKTR
jgi:hypothetical protein